MSQFQAIVSGTRTAGRRTARWLWPLALAGALMGAGVARAQVSVTLRPAAFIAAADAGTASHGLTLADIADLDPATGAEAEKLGGIIVGMDDATSISIAQVRAALDEARVNWGRISLSGSTCKVSMDASASSPMDAGDKPTSTPPPAPSTRTRSSLSTPQSVELDGGATLRGAVTGRLVDLFNVDPADLRLAFDARDEDFLNQNAGDRRIDVQPATNAASVRTLLNVYIYDGDRLAETRLLATQALINRTVVTARGPIPRGQAISSDLVDVGRQWLAPNAKPSVAPEAAIGQIAAKAINAGAMLTSADVTSPVVCKRGDIVWVHVLSGPLTVKAKCRAQGQARDGELVQLKLDSSDRIFSARMSGPGRAVMIADGTPDTGGAASAAGTGGMGDGAGEPPEMAFGTSDPSVRAVRHGR